MKSRQLFGLAVGSSLLLSSLLVFSAGLVDAAPVPPVEVAHSATPAKIIALLPGAASGQTVMPVEAETELALPVAIPPQIPLLQNTPVLTITKRVNRDPALAGDTLTYTITVTNGITNAIGVVISDFLDSNVSYSSSSDGGSHSAGVVTWNVGPMNKDETIMRTVTVAVSQFASGTNLSNTAEVTSTQGANDSVTILTPVNGSADVSISKTNGQAETVPGEETTYTITVSNPTGPSAVTGATVTDNFPSMSGVDWTCSGSGGATCAASGSGNINDSTVSLPVGGSVTYEATGEVDPGARGQLSNTATVAVPGDVTDPNPNNNSATDTDTLTPEADLRVSKSGSPDPVIAGNSLTYNLTVTNDGPSDATGVSLADNLPPTGVTYQSATPSQGTCTGTMSISCNLGTIADEGNATVTIVVTVNSSTVPGVLINIANVLGVEDDPSTGNNFVSSQTTVNAEADVEVGLTSSPNPVLPGTNLTYNATVVNNGPSTAVGVSLSDTLPAGVSYVSATPSQGSCNGTSTINCNLGNLVKNGTATVEIVVNVNESTEESVANTVTVSSSRDDPIPGNNSKTENTLVGEYTFIYLPIIRKPGTRLSIWNDKTGGNVFFEVLGTGVSCTVPNNATQLCGTFWPGTYNVRVTSLCGPPATFVKTYGNGPQTTRVFCN
jgi:uncharacterized repeat protein (TIGR01451 family)